MGIDERLENWSRYYRQRRVLESCGSIEKRYQAPWRQWIALSEIPYPKPIDWKDAELVELAWKKLSGRPKLILKYSYMTRLPVFVVARKCHVKVWNVEIELARSKRIIQKVLDRIGNFQDNNSHNLKPTLSRDTTSAQTEVCLWEEEPA